MTTITASSDLAQRVLGRAPSLEPIFKRYQEVVNRYTGQGHIRPEDLEGKRVLDWECGAGLYALLFVERGAAHVDAIDSWLWEKETKENFRGIERIAFERISIEEFAKNPDRHESYDFVFANTVTEHMLNLPNQLPTVAKLLKPGGLFITNHDNYYQPVGSHDHGFLFYGEGGQIRRQGPACWESVAKCAVSEAHRDSVRTRFPWTWDYAMEGKLSPDDCTKCPYFKRSQPWAHLRHQHEFREVFPQPCFTTGYPKSSLNKHTPFQVRQFIIEAGFDIQAWIQNRVKNEVVADLLKPPYSFTAEDLTTATITVVARKAGSPYDQ